MEPKKTKKTMRKVSVVDNLTFITMVLPGMLLTFLFVYLPMPGIVIAFKKFNPNKGIWGSNWVGLKNFEFFFTSNDALVVIRNTVLYSLSFLVVDLIAALTLALMLYFLRSAKAAKFYNTVVLIPKFMSTVIIAFIVYSLLSHSYGLVNSVIKYFGGEGIAWYQEPKYWPFILTTTHVWQTVGMNSVLYYASLIGMDTSLLEAARIDGANLRQQIRYVLIPHLLPIMIITTILAIGNLFSGDFGLFYQVTKDQGLLYPTTDIINTYTYRALLDSSMSKSTAVNLFQSAVGLILVVVTNAIVKKISPEHSMF